MNRTRYRRKFQIPEKARKLLDTGLFKRVGNEFELYRLNLIGTRYFCFVRISGETTWWYLPSGTILDKERSPYPGRPTHSILYDTARQMESEEVFDEIPDELVEKLLFHLDLLK